MKRNRRNFREWMQGRYGRDSVTYLLIGLAALFMILSWIPKLWYFYFFAAAMLALSILRSLSRNIPAREKENRAFLKVIDWFKDLFNKIGTFFTTRKRMWSERKTHKYYKCPNCGKYVRISKPPKGKKIMVTCSHCYQQFTKRT